MEDSKPDYTKPEETTTTATDITASNAMTIEPAPKQKAPELIAASRVYYYPDGEQVHVKGGIFSVEDTPEGDHSIVTGKEITLVPAGWLAIHTETL
jgi:hypothetical protein